VNGVVRPDDVVLQAAAAARACLQSLLAEDMGGVKEVEDVAGEQSTVESISRKVEEDGGGGGAGSVGPSMALNEMQRLAGGTCHSLDFVNELGLDVSATS